LNNQESGEINSAKLIFEYKINFVEQDNQNIISNNLYFAVKQAWAINMGLAILRPD